MVNQPHSIKALVLDIDGVLTDGTVSVDGTLPRRIHLRDLDALTRARAAGIVVAFLTGEPESEMAAAVKRCGGGAARFAAKDKEMGIHELAEEIGVDVSAICYVGDARRDVPALNAVGWGFVPSDADPEARRAASRVLQNRGGRGVVEEAVDLILMDAQTASPRPPQKPGVRSHAAEALSVTNAFVKRHLGDVQALANLLIAAIADGHGVLIFGNGGSAAMAQHAVAELVGRFRRDRRAVRAIALNTDTAVVTALANDSSYATVFSRQIEALGSEGDVAIAMSTSGQSPNVIAGLQTAASLGLKPVLMTGSDPDPRATLPCTLCLRAPSRDVPRIQEIHLLAWHLACESVEPAL